MENGQVYLWAFAALAAIIVLAQFIRRPGMMMWKLVKSAVIGCVFVFVVDWVGQYFHYHLPFNPATAMTAGLLGIPGVAALVATQLWILPM